MPYRTLGRTDTSRRWITRAVEASLRRLRTDHVDRYQVHRPAPDTDVEETPWLATLGSRFQDQGHRS